jgi:predicted dehydrogenase
MKRRDFLKGSAAAGVWIAGVQRGFGQEKSPNAKLNIGMIGVSGMRGRDHLAALAGENLAALCDVDDAFLGQAAEKLPRASKYADFREMLEKEKSLDAVCISTPDHQHAVMAVAAMKLGKHVYVEKPLAHSIYEARVMRETAAQRKVATQMGTQIHSGDNYRRVVELVRGGAIGAVREVHTFLGGARWMADGLPKDDPAPPTLRWDLWIGPAAERPYSKGYHPGGSWRKYWNFGGGDLADMGCHHLDLPFWALGLKTPLTAEARGPQSNPDGAPAWIEVDWTYAESPVRHTWYHGDRRPALLKELKQEKKWGGAGNLFVGEKGCLLANYGQHKLLPEDKYADFEAPKPSIPSSPGHHAEWIAACKGGPPALCNFDYAGALTESVLLGNVAFRTGRKIEWDAAAMKAKGAPEADAFLKREFRKGWTL